MRLSCRSPVAFGLVTLWLIGVRRQKKKITSVSSPSRAPQLPPSSIDFLQLMFLRGRVLLRMRPQAGSWSWCSVLVLHKSSYIQDLCLLHGYVQYKWEVSRLNFPLQENLFGPIYSCCMKSNECNDKVVFMSIYQCYYEDLLIYT